MQKVSLRIIFMSALAYILADIPVRMTGVLPSYAGIKNFLPITLGLFFGISGVTGCASGCILSSMALRASSGTAAYECLCTVITGLGMFYGWHSQDRSGRVAFKAYRDYGRYIFLLAVVSGLCGSIPVSCAYFMTGLFIGIPVNILFSSLLCVEHSVPEWCRYKYDAVFTLTSGSDSLETANDILEASADEHNITPKKIYEIQSCIEELSIRIFSEIPGTKITAQIRFGDAVSVKLNYEGRKYNPFRIRSGEDEIDIMSLKIIKHRALRASFSYTGGTNKIHVVV